MGYKIILYMYIIYFNRLDIILQHSSICTPRKSTKKVGEKLNARLIMKVGNSLWGVLSFLPVTWLLLDRFWFSDTEAVLVS